MKKILTICFSFLFIKAYSQKDFRPGYIIRPDGQKIHGLIDYRPNFSNFYTCFFKQDSLAEVVKYKPNQLKGYRLTDSKYYVTKVFQMDDSKDTCFMECLISGIAYLYYIYYNARDHYFIEKDTVFLEINNNDLLYSVEFGSEGVKHIAVKENDIGPRPTKSRKSYQYKGVLSVLFKDSPEIKPLIDNLNFNKESLIDITKTYHEQVCTSEPCIIYEKYNAKKIWNFGIFTATGIQKFIYNDTYYGGSIETLDILKPFEIGLKVQISNPDINNRFYFQYSISYNKFKIDAVTDTKYFDEVRYNINLELLKNELSI